jgi:hypothetical protein
LDKRIISPHFFPLIYGIYMSTVKTMIATAILATSASAMAAEAPSTAQAAVQTVAQQAAAPAQAKVEAAKANAQAKVEAAQATVTDSKQAAEVKAEKKGWFSWFKKAA